MVEPGETKVKSKGVEEKKVFKFKKKNTGETTFQRNVLIEMYQSYWKKRNFQWAENVQICT